MAGQHTPGPWAAFTDDSGSSPRTNIVAVVPRTDCVFSLPGHHKSEPNVRLIAAAPDLVEALKACRSKFEEYALNHYRKRTAEGDEKAAANQRMATLCDDALAKAAQS